jgi:hypothetical protein
MMAMVHDICSTLLTEFGTDLTTILPILFQYCYKYCYERHHKFIDTFWIFSVSTGCRHAFNVNVISVSLHIVVNKGNTNIGVLSFAGADCTTFLAPASICA